MSNIREGFEGFSTHGVGDRSLPPVYGWHQKIITVLIASVARSRGTV